jgi:transcriptional regulator with XRE-family HTH domain
MKKLAAAAHLPIPRRLRALRKVEKYETAKEFALRLGVSPNRYGNVEAGSSLAVKLALLICKLCPDVSMDWLYTGNERFLAVEYRRKIVLALDELEAPKRQGAAKFEKVAQPLSEIARPVRRSSDALGQRNPSKQRV